VALGDCVVVAVPLTGSYQPFLRHDPINVFLRPDRAVDVAVHLREFGATQFGERHWPRAKCHSADFAILRILHAEPHERHRRESGSIETDSVDVCLKPAREAVKSRGQR
jgi:hypothetical protein